MALTPAQWYKKPLQYRVNNPISINGVPQAGRANQFSTTPFYGRQIRGILTGRDPFAPNSAQGLIGASPDLSAMKAQFAAGSAADAASRDAALRRLVISYGQMPDLASLGISGNAAGFLKSAINDQVRALAAKNEAEGTSVHARQQKEAAVAQRRVPAFLAGRGLLRSGQTGVDLADVAQQAKNQQFDTLNELLGNIENTTSSFLAAERDRAMQLAMMEMQAAQQQYGLYQDSYMGPQQAPTSSVNLRGVPTKTLRRYPIVSPGRQTAVYRPGLRTQGGV